MTNSRPLSLCRRLPLAALVLVMSSSWCLSKDLVSEVYSELQRRHIITDSNAVQRAGVEAMLKAIDPQARIIDGDDSDKMPEQQPIEKVIEWKEGICYLKLQGLTKGAGEKVAEQINKWKNDGKYGVLLDARSAGGEDLVSVNRIAGLFVKDDRVLYRIQDRKGRDTKVHRADPKIKRLHVPVMFLIDGETHGACAMLAAVLKECPGVMLVGLNTSGDAYVRETIKLSENRKLYIATKRMVSASGKSYEPDGVVPDIKISEDEISNYTTPSTLIATNESSAHDQLAELMIGDAVLRRAADVLMGLKALGKYEPQSPANPAR